MSSYQVDREKWQKMSIFDQMGNIYSEVGRTFNAKQIHDEIKAQEAAIRAFDLFDATVEVLIAEKSPKLTEVLRAREVFAGEFLSSDTSTLDSYLMPFAMSARLKQIN